LRLRGALIQIKDSTALLRIGRTVSDVGTTGELGPSCAARRGQTGCDDYRPNPFSRTSITGKNRQYLSWIVPRLL